MKNKKISVGIFHRDELNRKAIIKLLENDFDCQEIKRWEDVKNSTAQILVLSAPELLYPEVSFEEVKRIINAHQNGVIMINKDNRKWWIYRMNFIQLRNPSVEQLLKSIEKLSPQKRVKKLIFRREIRA